MSTVDPLICSFAKVAVQSILPSKLNFDMFAEENTMNTRQVY